ncbi:hypothetical protein SO802_029110 [Lithocarpus litseifolius]|uniref:Reverse transcriptase zinc-binding domain-containing protein n=1 Tax=Lithocarpus litseifolius TaxID=425828 RepID=A0AAW2BU57_9ROSI
MYFLWLCCHNSIPTCKVLGSRGFTLQPWCPPCNVQSESVLHALRDYRIAKDFWLKLGIANSLLNSFSSPLVEWLYLNSVTSFPSKHLGIPCEIRFTMGDWQLWLQHNAFIYREANRCADRLAKHGTSLSLCCLF